MHRSNFISCFSFLILLILGCAGGGTAGTGGIEVSGSLRSTTGEPVSGATVELIEAGQVVETDANGDFTFDTDVELESVTFEVSVDSVQSRSDAVELPADAEKVTVELEYDQAENSSEVKSVAIDKRTASTTTSSTTSSTTTSSTTTTTIKRQNSPGGDTTVPSAPDDSSDSPDPQETE